MPTKFIAFADPGWMDGVRIRTKPQGRLISSVLGIVAYIEQPSTVGALWATTFSEGRTLCTNRGCCPDRNLVGL